MYRKKLQNIIGIASLLALIAITPAYALNHIQSHVPAAQKVGEGRLTYLFWDVYDATLYAPEGDLKKDGAFALKLSYLRPLEGKKIADQSIEEIRAQGITDEVKLAAWHSQMRKIFPDVEEGVSLTGVKTKTGETIFYKDSAEIGRIKDPMFSEAFFNIWLDKTTRAPDLRRKLLGII